MSRTMRLGPERSVERRGGISRSSVADDGSGKMGVESVKAGSAVYTPRTSNPRNRRAFAMRPFIGG
jgi:hypothetical protein